MEAVPDLYNPYNAPTLNVARQLAYGRVQGLGQMIRLTRRVISVVNHHIPNTRPEQRLPNTRPENKVGAAHLPCDQPHMLLRTYILDMKGTHAFVQAGLPCY